MFDLRTAEADRVLSDWEDAPYPELDQPLALQVVDLLFLLWVLLTLTWSAR